ncbi:tetratricopeptide repeat protein [Streptomyces sp. NPDC051561]|uniref:tetratricopeptide repeat protein n=1 Tax=Streptomyces sp. NPDC051561 TaxID=3365658 RepID=UPI00378F3DF6
MDAMDSTERDAFAESGKRGAPAGARGEGERGAPAGAGPGAGEGATGHSAGGSAAAPMPEGVAVMGEAAVSEWSAGGDVPFAPGVTPASPAAPVLSAVPAVPARRPSPLVRRVAVASLVVAVIAAGGIVLTRSERPERPAAKPVAGAPAAGSLTVLTARTRTNPRDDGAWSALGTALIEKGARAADATFYPRAEAALKRSLSLRTADRGNLAAMLGMAQLAYSRGDFGEARRFGEMAQLRAPGQWATYSLLIDVYGRLGDPKAAGRAAEELMEKRGGAAALGWTAQTYRDKGWREDAAVLLSQAAMEAQEAPEKAEQLRRAAELAWERGDLKESLGFFDASLALDRKQGATVAGRARVLAAMGRTAQAVKAYRAALALAPRPEYSLELGELTEATGEEGDGAAQFGVVRAQVEHDREQGVSGALVLGRLEADHGDAEAAVELLREEFSRHPGAEVADALGWALHRTGDDEAALEYARRAAKEGVRSALFLYHRGEIERGTGDYGAARRHLAEALRVNPVFSPLWAPRAQASLDRLGEPPEGGPRHVWPYRPKVRKSESTGGGSTGGGSRARSSEVRKSEPAPRKRR